MRLTHAAAAAALASAAGFCPSRAVSVGPARALAAEDCGCDVPTAYGGDVGVLARKLDHFSIVSKSSVLDVYGEPARVLESDYDGVAIELLVQLARELPKLEAGNVQLRAIGIGTPAVARDVAAHVGFPEGLLYADPDNALYDDLQLNAGVGRTFFNPATPLAIRDRLFKGGAADLGNVLGKWLPSPGRKGALIIPPKQSQAFNQGGMFVFDNKKTLLAHYDVSTGAHANLADVVQLALSRR